MECAIGLTAGGALQMQSSLLLVEYERLPDLVMHYDDVIKATLKNTREITKCVRVPFVGHFYF